MKPLRVGLIGYDGVQALDIIGPSDAFTIADIETDNGQRRPCYEVIIVGITNKPFRAESGVSFQPHTTLRNAPTLDTLIIPGGRGARIGQSSNLIAKWISSRAKRIRRIASVCTRGLCPRSNRLARWPESDNALAVRERCGATISKIECRSRRALFERRALLYRRRHYGECRSCSRAYRRRLRAARRAGGRARAGRFSQTLRRPETIFRAARVSD